jgi:hypothetical protein
MTHAEAQLARFRRFFTVPQRAIERALEMAAARPWRLPVVVVIATSKSLVGTRSGRNGHKLQVVIGRDLTVRTVQVRRFTQPNPEVDGIECYEMRLYETLNT